MEALELDLAFIWLLLIGFFLLYYAITDGADLGVGILSLFRPAESERKEMMESVGSIWHANQTWLVILGGMLFGAFPRFYSLVLSSLYIPIIVMLFGLIFRGVAFEFYEYSRRKSLWLRSFGIGSLVAALAQGFALGGLLGGLDIRDGRFAGTSWDWFTPYATFAATGVVLGYLMLGSNFLISRTSGDLQARSYRQAAIYGVLTLVVSAGVHLWTTALNPDMAAKWLPFPQPLLALATLLAIIAFCMYFRSLLKKRHVAPFFWNGAIIVLSFTGLSIGLYPHMIPGAVSPALTVQEVAASPKTLKFMLAAIAILLPIILAYTSYSYRVFRGKTIYSDDRQE